ncbi:hypothetical protein O181_070818 [Austropuccinia psidii MF-1]|uniref:Uncharacterized protein n=1 Tax=Austropuccinia psidii MF-1 TaxID=1389203 RepID=A0A9Q3F4L4_9BASI|nr:hypothetical protein [Austropuccinia psidii MF-1]
MTPIERTRNLIKILLACLGQHIRSSVSQASGPSEDVATTKALVSEEPTNPKHSWVWLYFTDLTNGSVECQVTNKSGTLCQQQSKCDWTGSKKLMSDHLNPLHCLSTPSK